MNELNFKYWLQGYAEICGDLPSKEQWEMIREHAELAEKNGAAIRATEVTYCPPIASHESPGINREIQRDFRTPFNIDPSKILSSC